MFRKSFIILVGAVLAIASVFIVLSESVYATSLKDPVDENDSDWGFSDDGLSGTSDGGYVYGPGTPPAGTGSAELSVVDGDGGHILYTSEHAGTPFSDITRLEYSTYRSSSDSSNTLAIALQFAVDYDLTDGDTGWQGRLVYEPYKSGFTIPQGTWQTWNALSGRWWATGAPGSNSCPQASPCTWAEIRTTFPQAGIRAGYYGATILKAGSGWTSGFIGNVDNLIIGINGTDSIYDFGSSAPIALRTEAVSASSQKTINEGSTLSEKITSIIVTLEQPLYDPPGNSEHDDVTNTVNYALEKNGHEPISIDRVVYSDNGGGGPSSIEIYFNHGTALPNGDYTLTVEGDTSVVNLDRIPIAGDGVHAGTDFVLHFTVNLPDPAPEKLPATGFQHGRVSNIPPQPASQAYTATLMFLSIPKLGLSMPIVGVPKIENGWDVSWLGNSVGYLAGSAFPTWAGNTVITGHVWDAFNRPGVFSQIKSLKYGDQVQIHAWELVYTYEVRESKLITVKNMDAAFQSEEYDWLTLLTCEFYNPFTGEYLFRRAVRAVLVDVR